MNTRKFLSHIFTPSRTILTSFGVALATGTFLLTLDIARTKVIPFIDLLFTAASSLCITGLLTVPIQDFTVFGQVVLMFLVQIGGVGLITLSLFVISLFIDLGLSTQIMAGELLDLETWKGTRKVLFFIISVSLTIEAIGSFIIFQTLKHYYPLKKALFYSVFQSVSAFCNSGIDVVDNGMSEFAADYNMLLCTSVLVMIGGVGFMTIRELLVKFNPFGTTDAPKKTLLSLQTRIILSYIAFLHIANTILFWLLERHNAFSHMTEFQKIINSFFFSICSRSAGFLTISSHNLQDATLFSFMINSFIGSAPGSTGSGIKITTLAILIAIINAAIHGKTEINIKGRRIMTDQVYKALAVVAIGLLWIIFVTFFLLLTETNFHFFDIFLESASAYSTLGITTGITPFLSIFGKYLIIATMFIGRIGSLTLMIALRNKDNKREFSYPEERVMIS